MKQYNYLYQGHLDVTGTKWDIMNFIESGASHIHNDETIDIGVIETMYDGTQLFMPGDYKGVSIIKDIDCPGFIYFDNVIDFSDCDDDQIICKFFDIQISPYITDSDLQNLYKKYYLDMKIWALDPGSSRWLFVKMVDGKIIENSLHPDSHRGLKYL